MMNIKRSIAISVALNIVLNVKAVHDVWGDFWFDFQGTNATVLYLRNSTKSEYSIPRTAFYDSNGTYTSYVVNKIADKAFQGKTNITSLTLPESMEVIGSYAFSNTHISSMIIPKSVKTFSSSNPFSGCDLLTTLFYTSSQVPSNWTATTYTYVPDKLSYSSPKFSINNAQIIEMISFNQDTFTYTGQSPTTTWNCNITGYKAYFEMPVLESDAGTYKVIIPVRFLKDGGGGGFEADVVYRYTIKPAKLKVEVTDTCREYGEDNPVFSFFYSGFINGENEKVIITSPSASTTATKTSDVGDYPITLSGGEAQNYTFVYEPGVLTVTKAPLAAKVDDGTRQYGTENPTFSVSYTGLKNGETEPKWKNNLKIETSATKVSDVGTYTVTATGTPTNYELPNIENGTLTITQAPLSIKANDASRKYFDEEPNFDYSCSGFLNNDGKQVLTKVPTLTTEAKRTSNVGKYKITPYGAKAKNYAISYEEGELSITKRQLAVTSHCNRQYGDENPMFPIEYTGFVNNETEKVLTVKPSGTTTATKTSPVGDYPINVSGGEAINYHFVYVQGVLTVTKASLSAKVSDATKVYGEQNPNFSIEYYGLKNGETIPSWTTRPTFQTEATKYSGVGKYTIKAVNGIAKNYDLEIADGTLTITPASLIIKANDATRLYYEEEPTFTFTCSGLVNNDDERELTKKPTFTTEATRISNVGKYKITPSNAEAKNYAISYEQGELSITKRQLIATSHCSRQYGEENPTLPIEYTGFVNNETKKVLTVEPVGTTTATKTSPVGNYPIKVSGGEAINYSFVYEQGVLTVTKASLSAKVSDASKVYGEQNPNFSIEYNGLKNGETVPTWTIRPTFQTEATKASGVGQYVVKAVNGVANNYDLEIADGTLMITPASLIVKANDATKLYYEDNPTFSYKCNGFVNGDNESVLSTTPSLSTIATLTSNTGTYEIIIGETSSPNYSISYVNGTLTVLPRTLIAYVGNYERIYNEENPMFEVKYEGFVVNENEKVLKEKAIASTTAIKTSDVGTYPIIVSGGSADNYQFSYTSGTLTINKAEQTISWEQDLSKLNVGDQIELKATASSGLPITYTMDSNNVAEIYVAGKDKTYLDCKAEGQFYLRAVQEGNKNYYSSTRVNKMVVIGNGSSSVRSLDDSSVKIFRMPFGIRVKDATIGEMIHVYSIDGILQKTTKIEGQITDIQLFDKKVYILKVGNKVVKMSL